MTVTMSSSFSVIAMAKPPALGTIKPAIKAPKIACTPMMSVKNADPNRIIITAVMKKTVGPLSTIHISIDASRGEENNLLDPVFRASHRTAIFTGKSIKSVHPTHVNKM